MLPSQPQWGTTGDQQLQAWTGLQDIRELRGGWKDLLEVVEEQQGLLGRKMFLEEIDKRAVACFTNAQRLGDRRGDQRGIRDRGEIDEECSVGESLGGVAGDFHGEPCLSRSRWSSERQEPCVRLPEPPPNHRQLTGAADQWARLCGKASHAGFATSSYRLSSPSVALRFPRRPQSPRPQAGHERHGARLRPRRDWARPIDRRPCPSSRRTSSE